METLQREHGGRALQNGWEKNLGEDRKIPKPNKKYLSNEEEDSTMPQWWGGGGGDDGIMQRQELHFFLSIRP